MSFEALLHLNKAIIYLFTFNFNMFNYAMVLWNVVQVAYDNLYIVNKFLILLLLQIQAWDYCSVSKFGVLSLCLYDLCQRPSGGVRPAIGTPDPKNCDILARMPPGTLLDAGYRLART